MLRRIFQSIHNRAQGQALVLFAAGLIAFLGLVGMSVDVGRFVWARTQIQAAVDASALAAAQSMPSTSDATTKANEYWVDNSGFIQSSGRNVQFDVTFLPGNKALHVAASAEVDTFFLKFVGLPTWNVQAEGDAASQVLDVSLVLDISGSMCWGSYPRVDATGPSIGPGRVANAVKLTTAIPSGSAGQSLTITVDNTAIFKDTNAANNNAKFGYNTTTEYYRYTPGGGRKGLIQIDSEIFLITAIPNGTQMSVTRGQRNNFLNTTPPAVAHLVNTQLWAYHGNCLLSAPATAGPYDVFATAMANAQFFTTLFNPGYDKIGLASFSNTAAKREDLTGSFATVQSSIAGINNPDGGTNTASGLAAGRQVLDGAGKRANAVRVMIFLTDGLANSYCGSPYNAANYNTTACPSQNGGADGNATANTAAFMEAQRAANGDILIYTIGLGAFSSDTFLKQLADGGVAGVGPCQTGKPDCRFFKAPTVADLGAAFASIAAQTHIALTN